MSDLETSAQQYLTPMIKGEASRLTRMQAEVCTVWALKTAMMVEFAGPAAHRLFPESLCRALYETQKPPQGLFAWIGAATLRYGFRARNSRIAIPLPTGQAEGNAMTLRIGHLVFQLFRLELENGASLQIPGKLATALRPLWPSPRRITWPPAALLDMPDVEVLSGLVGATIAQG